MENYKCKSVGIVGSGIQGVCIGLQLIKKGVPVTIFDRNDPLSTKFKQLLMETLVIFLHMQFYNLIDLMFCMMYQKCFLVHMDL